MTFLIGSWLLASRTKVPSHYWCTKGLGSYPQLLPSCPVESVHTRRHSSTTPNACWSWIVSLGQCSTLCFQTLAPAVPVGNHAENMHWILQSTACIMYHMTTLWIIKKNNATFFTSRQTRLVRRSCFHRINRCFCGWHGWVKGSWKEFNRKSRVNVELTDFMKCYEKCSLD